MAEFDAGQPIGARKFATLVPLRKASTCAFSELLHVHLDPRGLLKYIEVDFSIVRGLDYYTGIVFEVFDRSKKERALREEAVTTNYSA